MARGGVGAGHAAQSERRRAHLLSLTRQGVPIEKAVAAIPWTWRWYIKQRKQWPDFAAEMDAALAVAYGARGLPPPRQQSYARQHKFLAALRTGLTIGEACAAAGWTSNSSYRQWRVKDADFSAEVDRILDARVGLFGNEVKRDPNTGRIWNPADGFAEFRKRYLHTESPWFHIAAIEAMESMLPGSVLHILWPPEHGKTRLWEDYYTFLLAIDPGARLTIGSEKLAQSKKIVRFVRDRLESTAKGYERLREDWGPFAPMSPKERRELRDIGVDDIAAGSQAWGVEAFDVRKKPKGMEAQRDYSMQALGMGGSIIGTRCDRLGVDDPQGALTLRKKDSTAQLVETFRQDWLSRPGPTGRTYILANRVGPGDFHEELWENTDIIDRQIALPAWDPAHGGWLWPERYSAVDYRRMRKNAGEGAWERNYMQKGLANKDAAFSDKRIGNCKNNLRSILDPPPRPAAGGEARIIIGLDPGLSKASFHVAALEPHKFWSLDLRLLENARSYGIYGDVLDELCMQFHRPGISVVTHVIVETKAFQGGLLQDDRIIAARRRWSFDLIPFDTGVNKYDPDLGVPQMGPPMDYGEIDFPNKDQVSEDRYSPLYRQLRRWKPLVRGNKLEQDHVMTFWFCVHWWKLWRRTLASNVNPRAFDFAR